MKERRCSHVRADEVKDVYDFSPFKICGRPAKAIMRWGDRDAYLCGIHARRLALDDRLEKLQEGKE